MPVLDTGYESANTTDTKLNDSGLSPMEVSFLATGILFIVVLIVGFIYFLIFNVFTAGPSHSLMSREVERQYSLGTGGVHGGIHGGIHGGTGMHRKIQTRFSLFAPGHGGGGGSVRMGVMRGSGLSRQNTWNARR